VVFANRAPGARVKRLRGFRRNRLQLGQELKQTWESSALASAGRQELKAKQRVYDHRTQPVRLDPYEEDVRNYVRTAQDPQVDAKRRAAGAGG
jgi:hypothetical protein